MELTSGTPQQAVCREIEHVVHGAYDETGQRRLRYEFEGVGQETNREQHQTAWKDSIIVIKQHSEKKERCSRFAEKLSCFHAPILRKIDRIYLTFHLRFLTTHYYFRL